jgi:hypothetical protein
VTYAKKCRFDMKLKKAKMIILASIAISSRRKHSDYGRIVSKGTRSLAGYHKTQQVEPKVAMSSRPWSHNAIVFED